MDVVEIEVINWEKFNPRTDRKIHSWFRLENGIATEPKFFGLTAGQKFVAVCLFAEASKSSGGKTKINVPWFADLLKVEPGEVLKTIAHLEKTGVLKTPSGNQVVSTGNRAVTGGNQVVSTGSPTIRTDDTNETYERKREEERDSAPPKTPAADSSANLPVILPALAGNSKREQVLRQVSIELQQEWVDRYDTLWLKNVILQAVQYHTKEIPIHVIADWEEKLIRWFTREKHPKLKSKSFSVTRIKEPKTPWPTGALADPKIAAGLKKAKAKGLGAS